MVCIVTTTGGIRKSAADCVHRPGGNRASHKKGKTMAYYREEYGYAESRGNGYDWDYGMSNNAVWAYEDGRRPLSRFTAQNLKNAGWKETKRLALALATSGFWSTTEWHHTGGDYFNKVAFYDPAALVDRWAALTDDERQEKREQNKPAPKTPVEEIQVKGSYAVWYKSRGRRRISHRETFQGVKRGDWIHISTGGKKNAYGRNIRWEPVA